MSKPHCSDVLLVMSPTWLEKRPCISELVPAVDSTYGEYTGLPNILAFAECGGQEVVLHWSVNARNWRKHTTHSVRMHDHTQAHQLCNMSSTG